MQHSLKRCQEDVDTRAQTSRLISPKKGSESKTFRPSLWAEVSGPIETGPCYLWCSVWRARESEYATLCFSWQYKLALPIRIAVPLSVFKRVICIWDWSMERNKGSWNSFTTPWIWPFLILPKKLGSFPQCQRILAIANIPSYGRRNNINFCPDSNIAPAPTLRVREGRKRPGKATGKKAKSKLSFLFPCCTLSSKRLRQKNLPKKTRNPHFCGNIQKRTKNPRGENKTRKGAKRKLNNIVPDKKVFRLFNLTRFGRASKKALGRLAALFVGLRSLPPQRPQRPSSPSFGSQKSLLPTVATHLCIPNISFVGISKGEKDSTVLGFGKF